MLLPESLLLQGSLVLLWAVLLLESLLARGRCRPCGRWCRKEKKDMGVPVLLFCPSVPLKYMVLLLSLVAMLLLLLP